MSHQTAATPRGAAANLVKQGYEKVNRFRAAEGRGRAGMRYQSPTSQASAQGRTAISPPDLLLRRPRRGRLETCDIGWRTSARDGRPFVTRPNGRSSELVNELLTTQKKPSCWRRPASSGIAIGRKTTNVDPGLRQDDDLGGFGAISSQARRMKLENDISPRPPSRNRRYRAPTTPSPPARRRAATAAGPRRHCPERHARPRSGRACRSPAGRAAAGRSPGG